MLTDTEVATEDGWTVCVRTEAASLTMWATMRTFSKKAHAYEWADERALEQPRATFGVFRLHIIVRAEPILQRRGED